MKKGIVITANMLVMIIFVIVAAVILFFFYGSFASEVGGPSSDIFYNFLDFITGLAP